MLAPLVGTVLQGLRQPCPTLRNGACRCRCLGCRDVAEGELAGTRFVFLSYLDLNLHRFRLPLMRRLVSLGAQVFAVAPPWDGEDRFRDEQGIEYIPFEMRGASLNPLHDLKVAPRLQRLITSLDPHVLQTFMHKPNLLGGWLAARAPDMRVVSTVTGLGRLYEDGTGAMGRAARWGVEQMMGRAFSQVSAVVFQNTDDRDELVSRGVCQEEQARLIRSSGVDLTQFSPAAVDPARPTALRAQWGIGADEVVVTMVARLLPSKGVREFAAAAEALRGRAKLVLIGPLEPSGGRLSRGATIDSSEVGLWQRAGTLVAPGAQQHIEDWLAMSDVYALPSYYREGVPRSVLEGMAMGLPIVTTRMPGCRETVVEGENGFLVPPRDTDALVEALAKLADDPALRRHMGGRSLDLAHREFDSEAVATQHLQLYRELLGAGVRG